MIIVQAIFCEQQSVAGKLAKSLLWWFGNQQAMPSSQHVQVTLRVTPPHSSCPTLSADAEPMHKHTETIFSAQCDVTKSVL